MTRQEIVQSDVFTTTGKQQEAGHDKDQLWKATFFVFYNHQHVDSLAVNLPMIFMP